MVVQCLSFGNMKHIFYFHVYSTNSSMAEGRLRLQDEEKKKKSDKSRFD